MGPDTSWLKVLIEDNASENELLEIVRRVILNAACNISADQSAYI